MVTFRFWLFDGSELISTASGLVTVIAVGLASIVLLCIWNEGRKGLPPGPWGLPIIGKQFYGDARYAIFLKLLTCDNIENANQTILFQCQWHLT